jgi:hypothetical protein
MSKEVKNPISIIDKDEFIASPVTFINNEIYSGTDVNGLFTTAYESKLAANTTYDLFLNEIGNNVKAARHLINRASSNSADAVIDNYIIMNVSDLIQYTLNSFINDTFSSKVDEIGLYRGEMLMDGIDVRAIVAKYITSNMYPTMTQLKETYRCKTNNDPDPSLYVVMMDQNMNGLYAYIINNVFDKYIENVMNITYASNSLEAMYKKLYKEAYDEKCKTIPDIPTCYTFCTSILREIMDKYCMNFRFSLTEIAKSAAIMANNIISKGNKLPIVDGRITNEH